MPMKITQDQRLAAFDDGIVYEFVPYDLASPGSSCQMCSFYASDTSFDSKLKCYVIPCQKGLRRDKTEGFWQICKSLDYQHFLEILYSGG